MSTKKRKDHAFLAICEFKTFIKNFQKKNGEDIYDSKQNNLAVLKRTGKGNCVAFNKLFNSICKKKGVKFYSLTLENIAKPKDSNHQIGFVYDARRKSFWLQNNHLVNKLKSYNQILLYTSDLVGWTSSLVIPIRIKTSVA